MDIFFKAQSFKPWTNTVFNSQNLTAQFVIFENGN